ncbi:MAG: tetratricopeptide repeat protein [Gemmatimonadetes bacterium]|nr:tetratricopeptide repeat protein [Gemmatimonadota bacterium]
MSEHPRAARRPTDAWLGMLLLALLVVAYAPALNGGYVWDDDAHVTRTALRSLDGLRRIWFDLGATQQYYPLLHSAFWLEAQLWGDVTLGYHLTNVVLQFADASLIVVLAQRLGIRGAWLAGFLFALHPVHVESVAWISEQKNTLSLLFYLAAALAYLRFDERRAGRDYAIASALFLCALLTKTVTATLPAALLVLFWWQRGRLSWRRDARPLLPWFAVAAASGLFTAWVERHIIGAEGSEYALDALQRALLAARVICFYLGKLFWPADLIFTYPHWTIDPGSPATWGWVGLLVAIAAALWAVRGRSRAPLAALLLFCGSLFPVLGFLDIYPFRYSYVADHFQYLPSVGIMVAVAAGLAWIADRVQLPRGARLAAAGALVVTLGALTWRQSGMYADAETLDRATLERNPDSWKEQNNLGRLLARSQRRMPEAIPHYEAAIRLKPDHVLAHYSLGVALYVTGRRPEAVEHFRRVLRLARGNGLLVANSHFFLGAILMDEPGRLDEAIAELEEALRMKPGDAEVTGRLDEARALRLRGGR